MRRFQHNRTPRRGRRGWARKTGLLLAGLLWLSAGCGVKAPPVPPEVKPPVVGTLSHRLEAGGRLALAWDLAGEGSAVHYTLYQSRTPLSDEPCEGCPLVFKRLMAIPSDGGPAGAKTLNIEQGFRYGFKITATDAHGLEGPESNTIFFNY